MTWVAFTAGAYAQTPIPFKSNSTGADGALNYTTPGTYYFDPKGFSPPLDPAGDNIFNFTTINIATGVTLRLDARILTGPVYWLAQGDVTIAGNLDLSGGGPSAPFCGSYSSTRVPTAAGAGGFSGGLGAGPNVSATAGNGPGGGAAPAAGAAGNYGTFTGSQYLIPLVGGSGGSGGASQGVGQYGGSGASGGGAILIASSTVINVTGRINATGGAGLQGTICGGGAGSGGAIRLIANSITGSGGVSAGAGYGGGAASNGIIRLESPNNDRLGSDIVILTSQPFALALPATPPPTLRVASVNGVPITENPFTFPDTTINSGGPIPIVIQGQYVPLGVTPTLFIFSETGPDQTIPVPALQGTVQNSTATVNVTLPSGGSRGFVKAVWSQ